MTRVTIVRLGGDASLSAAQPLRVAGKETGKGGLEPDGVDTVTASFDGGPRDILVVASGARGATRVRVQVSVVNPLPPETTAR